MPPYHAIFLLYDAFCMLPRLALQSRESRTELPSCDSVWLATELTRELATALQLPFSPDNQPQIQVSLPQEIEELATHGFPWRRSSTHFNVSLALRDLV